MECHAYLVAAFLGLILLLAGFEVPRSRQALAGFYLMALFTAAAAGVLAVVGVAPLPGVARPRRDISATAATCPQMSEVGQVRRAWRRNAPTLTIHPKRAARTGCACGAGSADMRGGLARRKSLFALASSARPAVFPQREEKRRPCLGRAASSAQMRPPCSRTIRCTVASPTPVPGNSLLVWKRWNRPNIFSAKRMSKPAPLSRTK